MYVASALAVAITTGLFARLSVKPSADRLRAATCGVLVAGLLLMRWRMDVWTIPLLYIWIELITVLTALQLWTLAADVFDPRQAKRLFGIIGGGGSLAAIVVGVGVRPFVMAFGPGALLYFVAGSVSIYWLLGRMLQSEPVLRRPPARRSSAPKAPPIRLNRYMISITVIVCLSALVSQVVDYQFKIMASQTYPNTGQLAGYFGNFYAVAGIASLLVQLLLTTPILSRFGVLAGLVILPVFLDFGSVAILLRLSLWTAAFAKFWDHTLKHTLNHSAVELLWLPVSPDARNQLRPTLTGTYRYLAEVCGGLLIFFLLKVIALQYLAFLALLALVVWQIVVSRIKPLYTQALVNAIEKRQIDLEDLTIDAQDPEMAMILERTLNGRDEVRQLFALELIDGLPLARWSKVLGTVMRTGPVSVRARTLALCADEPEIVSDDVVIEAMSWPSPAALEAIRVVGVRNLGQLVDAWQN